MAEVRYYSRSGKTREVADDVLYLKSKEVKTHHTEIQNFAKKYLRSQLDHHPGSISGCFP